MKNPTAPTVNLEINGKTYTLLFSFGAIAVAEHVAKRPLLMGLKQEDVSSPTVDLIWAMLFGGLHDTAPKVTFEEVKAMVTHENFLEIWSKVLEAWLAAFPDPEEEVAQSDPPQSQS